MKNLLWEIKVLAGRVLCLVGLHDWIRRGIYSLKVCRRCPKTKW